MSIGTILYDSYEPSTVDCVSRAVTQAYDAVKAYLRFGEIAGRLRPALVRFARLKTPSHYRNLLPAEDMVQIAMGKASERLMSLAAMTDEQLRLQLAWLVRNTCKDEVEKIEAARRDANRTRSLHDCAADQLADPSQSQPDAILEEAEMRDCLDEWGSHLPEKQTKILNWRRQGYSAEVISQWLGLHRITVHKLYRHSIRWLRAQARRRGMSDAS